MSTVKCPTCGRAVAWVETEQFRPFCGERCKLIDLGEWATGSYAIPVAPTDQDLTELDEASERFVPPPFGKGLG
ncbi:DNA gyrase inhibitor YacG [Methylomagnum sp.]